MSRTKLFYTGKVVEGKIKINGRRGFDEDMAKMEGRRIQMEIKPYHATRSLDQNGYYFGCIIPFIQYGLNELGICKYELDKETVHEMLKAKFLKEEIAHDSWNGEFLTIPGSTTDLNKPEFTDYIEEIRQWAQEYLNLNIPDPERQAELQLKPGK